MSTNFGGVRVADPAIGSGELLSHVSGILLLLISAKVSLETLAAGNGYIDSLAKCICGIERRYNLSERDLRDEIAKESSFDGTLRLLKYVVSEVRDRLNDQEMAAEIQLCVDHLTRVRTPSRAPCGITGSFAGRSGMPLFKPALRRQ